MLSTVVVSLWVWVYSTKSWVYYASLMALKITLLCDIALSFAYSFVFDCLISCLVECSFNGSVDQSLIPDCLYFKKFDCGLLFRALILTGVNMLWPFIGRVSGAVVFFLN